MYVTAECKLNDFETYLMYKDLIKEVYRSAKDANGFVFTKVTVPSFIGNDTISELEKYFSDCHLSFLRADDLKHGGYLVSGWKAV